MSEQADKPKRKRCWFRFRLRTLLIAMLLLGVAMGLVGMRLAKYVELARIIHESQAWPWSGSLPIAFRMTG